jgi:DNA polymerase III delta subunit
MIYFIHSDGGKDGAFLAAQKSAALAADLLKKKPDANLFSLTDENWNDAAVDEYTAGQGLFEHKYIVTIRGIMEKKELKEAFLEKIRAFAESPNIFIVSAGSIDKASLKKISINAEKVQEIDSKMIAPLKDNSIFALADALGARDKKMLWILYREAIDAGKVPEEIHGILFWQAKCMAIALRTGSAAEAGLNPFVYGKSKRYAANFSAEELSALLDRLVRVYHDSHRGIHEFETALERLVLEGV